MYTKTLRGSLRIERIRKTYGMSVQNIKGLKHEIKYPFKKCDHLTVCT